MNFILNLYIYFVTSNLINLRKLFSFYQFEGLFGLLWLLSICLPLLIRCSFVSEEMKVTCFVTYENKKVEKIFRSGTFVRETEAELEAQFEQVEEQK